MTARNVILVGPGSYLWGRYAKAVRLAAARPSFDAPRLVLRGHVLKARIQRDLARRRSVSAHGMRDRFAADWSLFGFNAELRRSLWRNAR